MRSGLVRLVPLETHTPTASPHAAEPLVLICLLGPFRLLKLGHPVTVGGGKTEALLTHLALRPNRPTARADLLHRLWPDQDPTLAGQSLNSLVYALRKRLSDALGGASPILNTDGAYWLNTQAGVGTDIAVFDSLVQQGDQSARLGQASAASDAYQRALDLYRGELDAGGDLGALVERERLHVRYLTLLARLAQQAFAQGAYSDALDYAWRLLALDPCREDAHRLVMQCYVRLGERAQALHQFRLCADLLRTEFDAAPEPATVALFDRIRQTPEHV